MRDGRRYFLRNFRIEYTYRVLWSNEFKGTRSTELRDGPPGDQDFAFATSKFSTEFKTVSIINLGCLSLSLCDDVGELNFVNLRPTNVREMRMKTMTWKLMVVNKEDRKLVEVLHLIFWFIKII